jgi:drug/metabolite transporter (DMT)-like permease
MARPLRVSLPTHQHRPNPARIHGLGLSWGACDALGFSLRHDTYWRRGLAASGSGLCAPHHRVGCVGRRGFGISCQVASLAAIYIAAAPLAVAVLCHFFIPSEKLNAKRAIGIGVGFCGVCLLFAPAVLDHGLGATPIMSQLLLLIAAFLYASATTLVRLVNPQLHPVAMSFGFVTLAAIFSWPFAIAAWPGGGVVLEPRHIAAALGLGALCTGVANLLYVIVIRRVGPIFMSNVGNLAPFWSILVGAVAFGEALPATTFFALAILLFGVWLVQRQGAR